MSALVTSYPWVLAVAPVLIALVLGVGGRRLAPASPWLALAGPLITALAAVVGLTLVESGSAAEGSWNTSAVISHFDQRKLRSFSNLDFHQFLVRVQVAHGFKPVFDEVHQHLLNQYCVCHHGHQCIRHFKLNSCLFVARIQP